MGELTESMHKKEVISEKPNTEEVYVVQANSHQGATFQGYPIYTQMHPQIYPQGYPQQQMYPPQYHVNYAPQGVSPQMGPNNNHFY